MDFQDQLQKFQLAYATFKTYVAEPETLAYHQALRFTQFPTCVVNADEPAQAVDVLLVTFNSEHQKPSLGHYMVPDNFEGNFGRGSLQL